MNTCNNMDEHLIYYLNESNQTQSITYYTVPFYVTFSKEQTMGIENSPVVASGYGGRGLTTTGHVGTHWSYGNDLYPDCGDGCMTLHLFKRTEL